MSAQIIDFATAIPPHVLQAHRRSTQAQAKARTAFSAAVDRMHSGITDGDEAIAEIAQATTLMFHAGCLSRD